MLEYSTSKSPSFSGLRSGMSTTSYLGQFYEASKVANMLVV